MCVNVVALALLASLNAAGVEVRWIEGTLRGFPVVRDAEGRQIGDGTLTQYIEDGKLHAQGIFDLRDGRRVREETVLDQRARLRQLFWSWKETQGDEVLREFSVDLTTGHATARAARSGNRFVENVLPVPVGVPAGPDPDPPHPPDLATNRTKIITAETRRTRRLGFSENLDPPRSPRLRGDLLGTYAEVSGEGSGVDVGAADDHGDSLARERVAERAAESGSGGRAGGFDRQAWRSGREGPWRRGARRRPP